MDKDKLIAYVHHKLRCCQLEVRLPVIEFLLLIFANNDHGAFNNVQMFLFSENRIDQFGRFIKNMDESVKAIQDRGQAHCEKCQGCKLIQVMIMFCQM